MLQPTNLNNCPSDLCAALPSAEMQKKLKQQEELFLKQWQEQHPTKPVIFRHYAAGFAGHEQVFTALLIKDLGELDVTAIDEWCKTCSSRRLFALATAMPEEDFSEAHLFCYCILRHEELYLSLTDPHRLMDLVKATTSAPFSDLIVSQTLTLLSLLHTGLLARWKETLVDQEPESDSCSSKVQEEVQLITLDGTPLALCSSVRWIKDGVSFEVKKSVPEQPKHFLPIPSAPTVCAYSVNSGSFTLLFRGILSKFAPHPHNNSYLVEASSRLSFAKREESVKP